MADALLVNSLLGKSCMHLTARIVFSAPKYCDTTENKGAYINIGPDYKLDYHQFDAVPHPDIKPMVRVDLQPHSNEWN